MKNDNSGIKEDYRILKTLIKEKSFRSVREKLPDITEARIWKAISRATSLLGQIVKEREEKSLDVYIDGAAAPNPGPAGIGVVIYQAGKKLKEIAKSVGFGSNNVAEYKALITGLKECRNFHPTEVNIYTDSQLIVKQMEGEYRVNDSELRKLHREAKVLGGIFGKVSYHLIDREKNRLADQLANGAIRPV